MKNIKKILAILVAALMVAASMAVYAESVGALNVNSTLTVSGLDAGDKVTVYQVLEWDPDDPNGWKFANGVNNPTTTIDALLGDTDGANTITGAIASDLAAHAGTKYVDAAEVTGDTWTKSEVPAGLYMVIVEPATAGTIYNPIFVAANFYGGGTTDPADSANSIKVSENQLSYQDKAMAKKSRIPLDKTTSGTDGTDGQTGDKNAAYTTEVGEVVSFEITTHVPKFAANYTDPVFTLTDRLTGLELEGDITVEATDGSTLPSSAYTVTPAKDKKSYTVEFDGDYLKGTDIPVAGLNIKISYSAKVTDAAQKILNQENNTVDLIFSTTPEDTQGHGLLRDETNHFTFSIDADLLGHSEVSGSSTEAIKVGIDKEGNYIVESQTYAWSNEKHGPLEGAEFELLDANKKSFDPKKTVTSDASGRITILGLDAGTYYLKEITAPTGYIKLQDEVEVVITADISENYEIKDEVDNNGTPVKVTYKTNILNGYSVKIGGSTTHYTIDLSESSAQAIEADRTVDSSDSELANTKGVELPSTGGIGTTIFYVGGSILVLAAAILLVTKRRMSVEE